MEEEEEEEEVAILQGSGVLWYSSSQHSTSFHNGRKRQAAHPRDVDTLYLGGACRDFPLGQRARLPAQAVIASLFKIKKTQKMQTFKGFLTGILCGRTHAKATPASRTGHQYERWEGPGFGEFGASGWSMIIVGCEG